MGSSGSYSLSSKKHTPLGNRGQAPGARRGAEHGAAHINAAQVKAEWTSEKKTKFEAFVTECRARLSLVQLQDQQHKSGSSSGSDEDGEPKNACRRRPRRTLFYCQ